MNHSCFPTHVPPGFFIVNLYSRPSQSDACRQRQELVPLSAAGVPQRRPQNPVLPRHCTALVPSVRMDAQRDGDVAWQARQRSNRLLGAPGRTLVDVQAECAQSWQRCKERGHRAVVGPRGAQLQGLQGGGCGKRGNHADTPRPRGATALAVPSPRSAGSRERGTPTWARQTLHRRPPKRCPLRCQ